MTRRPSGKIEFQRKKPTPFHLNGVLFVHKQAGPSSHDIVDKARKALGIKRIGHCGTLDPFASGVLILLLGEATKLQDHFLSMTKQYTALFQFGETSDTLDITGKLSEEDRDEHFVLPKQEDIEALVSKHFLGKQEQLPPRFSAVKVQGKRAYALAREGKSFELQPKTITIYSIQVDRINDRQLEVHANVSAGTYMRSLVRDLAAKLGTSGMLQSLVRTHVGSFPLHECLPDAHLVFENKNRVEENIKPLQLYIKGERIDLDEGAFKLLCQGALFPLAPQRSFDAHFNENAHSTASEPYRLFFYHNNLVAIARLARLAEAAHSLRSASRPKQPHPGSKKNKSQKRFIYNTARDFPSKQAESLHKEEELSR